MFVTITICSRQILDRLKPIHFYLLFHFYWILRQANIGTERNDVRDRQRWYRVPYRNYVSLSTEFRSQIKNGKIKRKHKTLSTVPEKISCKPDYNGNETFTFHGMTQITTLSQDKYFISFLEHRFFLSLLCFLFHLVLVFVSLNYFYKFQWCFRFAPSSRQTHRFPQLSFLVSLSHLLFGIIIIQALIWALSSPETIKMLHILAVLSDLMRVLTQCQNNEI